jgi:hypothetical protein
MSDEDDNAEVKGASVSAGNGEEGHHDIDDDEEVAAHDDADQYDGEQNVEDAYTEVPLTSVFRDPHIQELLKNTTDASGGTVRQKSKLEQLEIDSNTPLYDTCCKLEDSHLRVALVVLQMKAKHDTSINNMLEYWKDRLPVENTCPSSPHGAKRITCPLNVSHKNTTPA